MFLFIVSKEICRIADSNIVRTVIFNFLIEQGIRPNLMGFHFMLDIIERLVRGDEWLFNGEHGLYNKVGQGKNWKTVERLCRYAKTKAKKYRNMTLKEWLCWGATECKERSKKMVVLNTELLIKCREYGLNTIHEINEFVKKYGIKSNEQLERIVGEEKIDLGENK